MIGKEMYINWSRTTLPVSFLCGLFLVGSSSGFVHAAPQGVPGQILVKFFESSSRTHTLEKLQQTTPHDLSLLSPFMSALSEHVGVRLLPVQLLGSDILMCQIDSQWLADTLKHRLAAITAIEQVEEDSGTVSDPSLPLSGFPKVTVRLVKETKEFEDLLAILEKDINLPLQGKPLAVDTLSLWVDLPSLTDTVIQALEKLPDLEFAQPNYRHATY